jgi:hypothetical protein
MFMAFEDRLSDSPFVERVWRCHSHNGGGAFYSMAEGNLELVVTRLPNWVFVTLRGPVTKASRVECPPNGEWLAIRFRPGTFLPQIPTALLLNHSDLNCPTRGDRFWFAGRTWEIPSFENAETFVGHLARLGIIARDGAVSAVVSGDPQPLTVRSVQRHFLRTIGMTHGQFRQIERARQAADLLRDGWSILEVVDSVGYFDQAHLTRSLRHLIGLTPAKLSRGDEQLSFSYKTTLVATR